MKNAFLFISLVVAYSMTYGQKKVVIDGDELSFRDSLDGKVILLNSIERGKQNPEALWIQYNRKPGVDPWIRNPINGLSKFSEENFIQYFHSYGIIVLGAFTTYDDCLCYKHKTGGSPDMHLINFKISTQDWEKLNEFYVMDNAKVL